MKAHACSGGERVNSWHVAFAQECNLRCDYCITGYGALGGSGGAMDEDTQALFIERALSWLGGARKLSLSFGCGETFLHFDAFAAFVGRLQEEANRHDVALALKVTTNGTCLDEARLVWCLENRVQLSFSIDGAATAHDRHRLDEDGAGTHAKAIAAWRRYNALATQRPGAAACRIRGVVAEGERLADAIAFWEAEGAVLFDPTIEEPSPFAEQNRRSNWDLRRRQYLEDLEDHAMRWARKSCVPHFLRDYRGPSVVLQLWTKLFLGGTAGSCGAGCSTLAVDCHGGLFPCDGFVGHERWRAGSLLEGIDRLGLTSFREAVAEQRRHCISCGVRDLCDGGCVAARPDGAITLNYRGGCRFFAEVAGVARRSYEVLQGQVG